MTSTHDFGFGPIPAHRHPNGGGWVADTASVDSSVYVGSSARVYGNAQVFGGARVYGNSRVHGDARIFEEARVYGDAQVSKTPLTVTGAEYPVTICDNLILVGCQAATLGEWRTHCPERCPKLEAMRQHLLAIVELHQG